MALLGALALGFIAVILPVSRMIYIYGRREFSFLQSIRIGVDLLTELANSNEE